MSNAPAATESPLSSATLKALLYVLDVLPSCASLPVAVLSSQKVALSEGSLNKCDVLVCCLIIIFSNFIF
ncbi:hypothetical protein CVS40_8055 [Lucilia cuprina]|nr:hypothetical protein CVS40_8055 [Lucilia cuprina]